MPNLNFDNYFDTTENKYYDSKIIITILEDILGKKMNTIKKDVNNIQIVVTKEQIEEFLNNKFIEENNELKTRIENPTPRQFKNILDWTKKDIEDSSQEFFDNLNALRYRFEPYTLKYFKKYVTIVRKKATLLLDIIEKIGYKDYMSIQETLANLDIQLDDNGNILREDIIRLITPTIYNINELNKKIEEANDLSTYLTFKMSKHSLYRDGFSEEEIYPEQSIQTKNLHYDYIQGNIPLSNNQRKKLEERQRKNRKKCARLIIS